VQIDKVDTFKKQVDWRLVKAGKSGVPGRRSKEERGRRE
jgi:hypothetical protein